MKKCLFSLIVLAIFTSCGSEQVTVKTGIISVKVEEMVPQQVSIIKKYPADILGEIYVAIKPQVSGYIESLVVEDGAKVCKGDVLVKISEDNYIQAVNSAKATVGVAEATVENAKLDVERTESLYNQKIVSEYDFKSAKNRLLLQEAQLKQAEAMLQKAEVNLKFTNVTSPTDGIIGLIDVSTGALVSPSDPKPITIVSDIENMFVYFGMSEVELLNLTAKSGNRSIQDDFQNPKLLMANNQEYEYEGTLDVISGVVDRETGIVNLRATFKNNGDLRGGSNGYILLPIKMDSVLLVPQSMTTAMQDKISVYVVDKDNLVSTRFIEVLNETYNDSFVVTSGLNVGDKVVVQNAIKITPGMKVAITQ